MKADFVLEPFPGLPTPGNVRVSGAARRVGPVLHLDWKLVAPAEAVAIAAPVSAPERRHGLWEDTCFEFFLSSPYRPGYWEFNLSPAGHWNVYRFEGYRAGMVDETAFESLPFTVMTPPGRCEVSARLDMSGLGLGEARWRLAVSVVLKEPRGDVTYWALCHPGAQPDFHHPDAFVLSLGEAAD